MSSVPLGRKYKKIRGLLFLNPLDPGLYLPAAGEGLIVGNIKSSNVNHNIITSGFYSSRF